MGLVAKDKGGDFTLIPADMHHGICYAVIDIGTQPAFGKFPARRKVIFIFELPHERGDFEVEKPGGVKEKKNLPRAISSEYTLSLAQKSNLRPDLESWRGRPFTQQELDGFDLFNVAGANALLNVIHESRNQKTYANIASISPLMKGTEKLKPENPIIKFSIDEYDGKGLPPAIPEWIRAKIMQSSEYLSKFGEGAASPENHGAGRTPGKPEEEQPPF